MVVGAEPAQMRDLAFGDGDEVGPDLGRRRAAVLAETVAAPRARVVARDELLDRLYALAHAAEPALRGVLAERRREGALAAVAAELRVGGAQLLAPRERPVQRRIHAERRR